MKYVLIILILFIIATVLLSSCTGFRSQKASDYTKTTPAFDITKQLGGDIVSQGLIYGPTGKVNVRFNAKMRGDWNGNQGVLREDFTYDNGNTQTREWHITLGEGQTFTATAADVIGQAEGEISGATLRMSYKIQLTEAAGGHILDVVDWIYLIEDGTMINKSEMRKFGVKVAELVGTIRPAP